MQKICIINKSKTKTNEKTKYIRKNNKGKFIVVMCLAMFAVSIINNIYATTATDSYGKYNVFSYSESNRYIKYNSTPQRIHEYYYLTKSGEKFPAYCMNLGLNGAETVEGGYSVNANEILNDKVVNNIILNGYPYKTVSQLQLANESEARYATQFAIWIKLNNLDINAIVPMQETYQRVVDAIKTIYYNGINFNLNYTNGVSLKEITKDSILDDKDQEFYSKIYELEYGDNILDIDIKVEGVNDYIIADENNKKLNNILPSKKIKILFPRKSNMDNSNCKIKINSKYKEGAMLFAKSEKEGMQDVTLTLQPIKTNENDIPFKFSNIKTSIVISKVDASDKSINIPNVKFNIYDLNDKLLGTFVTNNEGKINIELEKDLKLYKNSKIKIKEVEVPYPYIIDQENSVKIIDVRVGNIIKVEFENNKVQQKAKIELPKTGF